MTEVYEIYVADDEDPNQVLKEILEEASRQQTVLMPDKSKYRLPLAETYPGSVLALDTVGVFEKSRSPAGYDEHIKWVMLKDLRQWKERHGQ